MRIGQQVVFVGGATTSARAAGWLILLSLVSCGKPQTQIMSVSGSTMGTTFSIKLAKVESGSDSSGVRNECFSILDLVNRQMSTYDPDSELSRFNASRSEDWFSVSPETAAVAARALEIAKATSGAYDPTVMPLVDLWGFGPRKAEKAWRAPSEAAIAEVRAHVGYDKVEVRLNPPALRKTDVEVTLDLSSIAKGHAVDRMCEVVSEHGFGDYFVEIGGEVRAQGATSDRLWNVGLEQPREDLGRSLYASVELENEAIATSGNYRQFFEQDGKKYGHSIDARSGWPVSHALRSVSVVAETCEMADAWATALMILGPDEALAFANENQIAALFLIDDGAGGLREQHSAHWTVSIIRIPGK